MIVIPCYNRKAVTLRCLSRLEEIGAFANFQVLVVDDASTDGTSEAIARDFPHVEVLQGNGELYWTGAMELGMRHAISRGASCCVWLNDDLTLDPGGLDAITRLAMEENAIVTGQGIINLSNGGLWYFPAVFRGKSGLIVREIDRNSDRPIPVDSCRGNMVAIPKTIVDKIGYPDGLNIPHMAGDSDYALRATAAGFRCLTLPSAVFYEQETIRNDNRSWLLGRKSVVEIWKTATSKRGVLYPRMIVVYHVRHWGLRGCAVVLREAVRLGTILLLRLTLPQRILHRLFAGSSHAYQTYLNEPEESRPD